MAFIMKTRSVSLLRNVDFLTEKAKIKTAGIIVIGDEILRGEVQDTNSSYVANTLHKLGISLKKISVIGDSVKEISSETKLFSNRYNYVITTGGIGPTHDDVTFEGIAKAFNERLMVNKSLAELCYKYYNTHDIDSPEMKLAKVPESAQLIFPKQLKSGSDLIYPNVSVHNVYIFPGIPQLLRKSIDTLGHSIFKSETKFYTDSVYLNVGEQQVVRALNQLVGEFPDVMFGSYPELKGKYKVKVTIESTNKSASNAAKDRLLAILPTEYLVKM